MWISMWFPCARLLCRYTNVMCSPSVLMSTVMRLILIHISCWCWCDVLASYLHEPTLRYGCHVLAFYYWYGFHVLASYVDIRMSCACLQCWCRLWCAYIDVDVTCSPLISTCLSWDMDVMCLPPYVYIYVYVYIYIHIYIWYGCLCHTNVGPKDKSERHGHTERALPARSTKLDHYTEHTPGALHCTTLHCTTLHCTAQQRCTAQDTRAAHCARHEGCTLSLSIKGLSLSL